MKKFSFFYVVLFSLFEFVSAHAEDYGYYSQGMMHGYYGMFGGNLFFNGIVNLLIVGVLVLLLIWLFRKIQNENKNARRSRK